MILFLLFNSLESKINFMSCTKCTVHQPRKFLKTTRIREPLFFPYSRLKKCYLWGKIEKIHVSQLSKTSFSQVWEKAE